MERKFIDLKALKVSDEGSGTIEGYRSVFGEIDEGGDIVVKGFFADGIDEYLQSGFTAHSHDWNFSESVGFPVDAKEDDHGFFVTSQFHSTPDAQNIRTKARERMEAGKTVGFSFGYQVKEKKYIEAKDFKDQLPQFIKPERLAANMKKAQEFSRIRILLKGETIEDSLVTSPMNKLAKATGVKSADTLEAKGLFEDVLEERTESLYFLWDCFCSALYRAQYVAESDSTFDLGSALDVILSELGARIRSSILDVEDGGVETASLRGPIGFKGDLRDRLPFAKHAETVLGAVEVFAKEGAAIADLITEITERGKAIQELREAKAGATYSGANLAHMQRIHTTMKTVKKTVNAMHDDMAALIEKAKPKEKSDDGEIDVAALRAQSLKVQSQALMH